MSVGILMAAVAVVGCGKKGPPLAPLVIVPARIQDIAVRRQQTETIVTFTLPRQNQDNTTPADLARVEVYAITGNAVDETGRTLEGREFMKFATLVGTVEAEPPPEEPEEPDEPLDPWAALDPAAAPPPPEPIAQSPDDPRPAQGEIVRVRETFDPKHLVPFVHPDVAKQKPVRAPLPPRPVPTALGWPLPPQPLARTYVAVGVNKKGQYGALSPRVAAPLTDLPPAPANPELTVTEQTLSITWPVPAGLRGRIAATPVPPELTPRLILQGATPHTYNVYAWPGDQPMPAGLAPANPAPLDANLMGLGAPVFGVARCYAVRVVEAVGRATLESPLSAPTCITPTDTFAPQAPSGLQAVGSEGVVNLIWSANTEADLDGYLVLRSEAPNEPAQALTPAPVKETTFRDPSVTPGVRYAYAIVAVDTRGNRSTLSNKVEESAR